MSYKYEVLSDLPTYFFPLDETSGTVAYDLVSGNNAIYSTLPPLFHPLVYNGNNSKLFSTQSISGPTLNKIWNNTKTAAPFSVEFWIAPIDVTARTQVCGISTDGVYISPQGFEFIVGTVSVFAPISDWNINYHVVALYDSENISIYVNGQLVNTEASDIIGNAARQFNVNPTSSSNSYVLSCLAIWNKALLQATISNHYLSGIYNTFHDDFTRDVSSFYTLTETNADIAFQVTEDSEFDFIQAVTYNNVFWDTNRLVPVDNTQTATRTSVYNITHYGIIDGSRIDWSSNSAYFSIDISLDNGTTWTAAMNHSAIPGLSRNINVSTKGLMVRQNFAVGTITDIPYLEKLNIIIYSSKYAKSTDGVMDAVINEPVELAEQWTMPLLTEQAAKFSGGNLVIPSNKPIYGIEFMVRVDSIGTGLQFITDARTDSAGAGYLGLNGGAINYFATDTYYINGVQKVPAAADFPVGKWVHVAIQYTTPLTGRIYIGSNSAGNSILASYQTLGLYYSPLNAYRIQRHAMAAFGSGYLSVSDGSLTLTEIGWNVVGPDWSYNG